MSVTVSADSPTVFEVTLPDGRLIPVQWVKRAGARSLRVSISSHGARVSSPKLLPAFMVKQFLQGQRSWLAQHMHVLSPLENNELWYRGQPYKIQLVDPHTHKERVRFADGVCYLAPVTATATSAQKLLDRWLESQAGEVATPLLQTLSKKMGVEVPQLRFRQTKSRWGSCSAHGAIMLNWRLIHTPDEVFRYVIIHELAHRVHMNHSKAFWDLVRKFDPSYPIHQGWLKRNGSKCKTPELR